MENENQEGGVRMKVTICDMCGEVFKARTGQENTIGYVNYDLCDSCINRLQREMLTHAEDYEDRLKYAVSEIVHSKDEEVKYESRTNS